ncbi:hypothetical protein [Stenotrophomonas humi]
MRTFHSKLATTLVGLGMLFAASAQAQTYGPRDEGRRFDDGSRVECRKVEVANNARNQERNGQRVIETRCERVYR